MVQLNILDRFKCGQKKRPSHQNINALISNGICGTRKKNYRQAHYVIPASSIKADFHHLTLFFFPPKHWVKMVLCIHCVFVAKSMKNRINWINIELKSSASDRVFLQPGVVFGLGHWFQSHRAAAVYILLKIHGPKDFHTRALLLLLLLLVLLHIGNSGQRRDTSTKHVPHTEPNQTSA